MRKATPQLRALLVKHEGCKLTPYHDTLGILTIGVGRNLTRKPAISNAEAMFMLDHDIEDAEQDLANAFPWLVCKDDGVRHDVLVNMVFNLGISRFKRFKKMIAAYERDDYQDTAQEMMDSKWARQVGQRADELARMMITGVYNVR